MKKTRPGGCLGYLLLCLMLTGAFVSWLEFLFKPVAQVMSKPGRGTLWLIGDLLSFRSETYGTPLLGYAFFFAAILLAAVAVILVARPLAKVLDYLEVSEAPISILETEIILTLEEGLKKAKVTRSQKVHANRSDVNAYHQTSTAAYGEIKQEGWSFESRIDKKSITKDVITIPSASILEVIEIFDKQLPTSYRVTYLPNSFVVYTFKNFGWFNKYIVERETTVEIENEYDHVAPYFQLKSTRYPATNVVFRIDFPISNEPKDMKCFLISDNIAQDLPAVPDKKTKPGRCVFTASVDKLAQQQSVRFQWRNK